MSTQKLQVEIEGDASGLVKSTDRARDALGRFVTTTDKANAATGRARDALGRFVSTGQRTETSVNSLRGSFSSLSGSLTGLSGGFFSLTAAFAAVKKGLQITSDFQRLDASLKAVSRSQEDYTNTQAFLRSAADTYGLSIEALAGSYKGLKAASNGTALEGRATEKIFMAVAKASAALKLTSDQTEGALLALQQMMSKGTVQAEELRGQLGERIPGAFKLFADAAGVSERQLSKMLEAGEVAAVDVLPKFAEQLEKVYGSKAQDSANGMAAGFQRMTDQLKMFVAEFAETTGIDTFFGKLGNGIANYIKGLREAQKLGLLLQGLSPTNGYLIRAAALAGQQVQDRERQKRADFEGKNANDRAAAIRNQESVAKQAGDRYYGMVNSGSTDEAAKKKASRNFDAQSGFLNELIKLNDDLLRKEGELAKVPPTFEKLESKLKGLKSQFLDLRAAGNKSGADKIYKEYEALQKKIDTIEGPFNKVKKAKKEDTWAERMRKDLKAVSDLITEFEAKNAGKKAPLFLRLQKGYYQDQLKEVDKASEQFLDITDKQLKLVKTRSSREFEDWGKRIAGYGEKHWGEYWQKAADGTGKMYVAADKLQQYLETAAQKAADKKWASGGYEKTDAGQDGQLLIRDLKEFSNRINQSGTLGEAVSKFFDKDKVEAAFNSGKLSLAGLQVVSQNMMAAMDAMTVGLRQAGMAAFGGLFEAIGQSLGGAKNAFNRLGKSVLGMLADLTLQIGKSMLMFGAAMMLAGIPTPQLAAGAALTVAGGFIKALSNKGVEIPAYAKGGVFTKPGLGIFGDNKGAGRGNPEIAAPINTIKKYLEPNSSGMNFPQRLEFEVRGTTLIAVMEAAYEAQGNNR
ncbi:hypothetical protein GCM10027299_21950 [Larkinella ripae]